MAVTVKGIGTCASVSPPALSAALTSSSEAFLTKPRIVRLLPDAVVHLDDFDVADLEFDDALVHQGRLLRERGREELQRPVEPEGGPPPSPPRSRSRGVKCFAWHSP